MLADNFNALINGIVLSGLGAGAVFSLRERRKKRQWRSAAPASLPSSLSHALAQLVGTAGGIYLSLELLCSFLGLRHEDWQGLTPLTIDPLAALSLFIAIIQPYVVKVWGLIRRVDPGLAVSTRISNAKSRTKPKKRR